MQTACVARSVEFWWRALRTVQMVAMQAERFDIALQQLELAERDAADRASLNATTELNLAIRANRDAQPFARRPVRIPTWAPVSYTHLDVYKRQDTEGVDTGVVVLVGLVLAIAVIGGSLRVPRDLMPGIFGPAAPVAPGVSSDAASDREP